MRLIWLILFIGGCSWWQAGVNDPSIVNDAVANADIYRKLASATGIPYADMVAGLLAVWMTIMIKGKNKANG